jgi:uncharacterized phage protein (TIGR02216 family)
MQLGLGVLRLGASDFWRMTPRELEAALTAAEALRPSSIERRQLEELMKRFPDEAR